MSTDHEPQLWRIALIGYGEVGRILAEDLRAQGLQVAAHDLKLARAQDAQELIHHASEHGVRLASTHAEAVEGAHLVISAVTARQTFAAAQSAAPGLSANTFFLDLNSASPGAKQQAAHVISAAGARYVEAAVMTSVPPYRIRVPMLLGGPDAQVLAKALQALGFEARVVSDRLGVASATKMCRSVMIKGLEAMVIESLTAARHYGVEDAVIASLRETFPGIDWERQTAYFFQRVIEHGRRRAEEMRESAHTIREAGLTPWLAEASAQRQEWMAQLAEAGVFGRRDEPGYARHTDWRVEADRILAQRRRPVS